MTESERARRLIDEWHRAEERITAIKVELSGLLGVGLAATQTVTDPPPPPPFPAENPTSGPAGKGTRGRAILEVLARSAGKAVRLDVVAEEVYGGKDKTKNRQAGCALNYLRRQGLARRTGGPRSGLWLLTKEGQEALAS